MRQTLGEPRTSVTASLLCLCLQPSSTSPPLSPTSPRNTAVPGGSRSKSILVTVWSRDPWDSTGTCGLSSVRTLRAAPANPSACGLGFATPVEYPSEAVCASGRTELSRSTDRGRPAVDPWAAQVWFPGWSGLTRQAVGCAGRDTNRQPQVPALWRNTLAEVAAQPHGEHGPTADRQTHAGALSTSLTLDRMKILAGTLQEHEGWSPWTALTSPASTHLLATTTQL